MPAAARISVYALPVPVASASRFALHSGDCRLYVLRRIFDLTPSHIHRGPTRVPTRWKLASKELRVDSTTVDLLHEAGPCMPGGLLWNGSSKEDAIGVFSRLQPSHVGVKEHAGGVS